MKIKERLIGLCEFSTKETKRIYMSIFKFNKKYNTKDIKFNSLAPTDNAENSLIYSQSIEWGIKEKDINNIAITGNYGSGKSSILKSYQSSSKYRKNFLNISLASINEAKQDENLIEKSILQQLFYREKGNKIPYSRFKKINNLNDKIYLKLLIVLLLLLLVIWVIDFNIFLHFKDLMIEKFNYSYSILPNDKFNNIVNYVLKILAVIVLPITFLKIMIWIIKTISNLSSKLILKKDNLEIEISKKDKENNESIFNKYIDEILYFFEVTKYNVVVFEDLDRLENSPLIFTKLRELNILLNNSNMINKKIVFIYAIKDNLFTEKERTKFFDFIIPVIPIINSANSKDKLLELLSESSYKDKLDKKFVNHISLYINDMRILNSIINEFYIFSKLIKVWIDDNKLFAMIVFKNICPNEFALLQNNEGDLYNILNNKKTNLFEIVNELETQKKNLHKNLEILKSESIENLEDYKRIIWGHIEEYFSEQGYNYIKNGYSINNSQYSEIADFLNSNITIQELESAKVYKIGVQNLKVDLTYIISNLAERWERITEKKDNKYIDNIEDIDRTLNDIYSDKVSTIISKYGLEKYYKLESVQDKNENKKNLINKPLLTYLLENGFIDESYRDYINYFYPNTLTIDDKNFIIDVDNLKTIEHGRKITNIKEVLEIYKPIDFNKKQLLNFDLCSYMLKNENEYMEELDMLFMQLQNNSVESNLFLTEFIKNHKNLSIFAKYFTRYCFDSWEEISNKLPKKKLDRLLYMILLYSEIDDIKSLSSASENFVESINNNKIFIRLFVNHREDRLRTIVDNLEIKLNAVDKKYIKTTCFDILFKKDCYALNVHNIKSILAKKYDVNDKLIISQNYSTIMKYSDLLKYVNEHISEYIKNVFLELDTNVSEELDTINNLIGNSKIEYEIKRKIIKSQKVVDSLDKIVEPINTKSVENQGNESAEEIKELDMKEKIWAIYLEENKVKVSYSNILVYYNMYKLDDILLKYINSHEKSLNKDSKEDYKKYRNLFVDIAYQNDIKSEVFQKVWSCMNNIVPFVEFDFSRVNSVRTEEVLSHKKICICFTRYNYSSIRANQKPSLTDFVIKNIKRFIELQHVLEYDIELLNDILKNTSISRQDKLRIIHNTNIGIFCKTEEQSNTIMEIILKGKKAININSNLLISIFSKNHDMNKCIRVLEKQNENLTEEQISECLRNMTYPYFDIPEIRKTPKMKSNPTNTILKDILERKLSYISRITVTKDNYYQINKKKVAS
jgi:hypothetical protein